MRIVRKVLRPLLVRELTLSAKQFADAFYPELVFVFKGNAVHPNLIRFYKGRGVPVVNFYPDVSFHVHGPYIPRALPLYDHVFTSKSWGVADMKEQLGVNHISVLEHGYDPELDHPLLMSDAERARFCCDVIFIGTWSPKKEMLLSYLKRALPDTRVMIWGGYWEKSTAPELTGSIVGAPIIGDGYSKVLQAASICLGILSESRKGASSGDLVTSRTFNIPACGAFMLHERNEEVLRYFREDEEAAFFESPDELVDRVEFYLQNPARRAEVAQGGRERCEKSGYSIDDRMKHVIQWLDNRPQSTNRSYLI